MLNPTKLYACLAKGSLCGQSHTAVLGKGGDEAYTSAWVSQNKGYHDEQAAMQYSRNVVACWHFVVARKSDAQILYVLYTRGRGLFTV